MVTPAPSAWMETLTSLVPFSMAKTLTGRLISSPVESIRGKVESNISGVRTETVFSVWP